jgi:hypothetical protein
MGQTSNVFFSFAKVFLRSGYSIKIIHFRIKALKICFKTSFLGLAPPWRKGHCSKPERKKKSYLGGHDLLSPFF